MTKNDKNQTTNTASKSDTNVESPTSTSNSQSQCILSLLNGLKNKSDSLKTKLCTATGKLYANITALDIKSSNKISKTTLADDMLTLLGLADKICCTDNINFISNVSDVVDVQSQKSTDINSQLATSAAISEAVDKSLKQHSSDMEQKLSELISTVSKLTVNNTVSNTNFTAGLVSHNKNITEPSPQPKTSTPTFDNPTKCVESSVENFVDDGLSKKLCDYLDNCQQFQDNVENGHSVISFGEAYHYTGSKANQAATEIPDPFNELIKVINSDPKFADSNVNSVLVNKYSGPGCFLPKHSDNEFSIEPGSLIFSVSLGQSCKITFDEIHSGKREELVVNNNSLYTMTQASQWFWTHEISADSTSHFSAGDVRYSITLRSVGSRFHNSTVIIGDSNTKHLKFGEGKGTFGYYYPGKRIQAPLIDNIDVTTCAGYSNIIVQCGINDIKHSLIDNHQKVAGCFNKLQYKIELIQKLCPTSRLIISPILPTRDLELSRKALDFNEMLFTFEDRTNYIQTLNFNCFTFRGSGGILLDSMGCHNRPDDILHLGSEGIKKLVSLIRDCLRSRKVGRRSFASVLKGVSPTFINTDPIES